MLNGMMGPKELTLYRDGCVSNKRMRLHNDDGEMEGGMHYAECLVSDDDEAMCSNADLTETEVAETLEFK